MFIFTILFSKSILQYFHCLTLCQASIKVFWAQKREQQSQRPLAKSSNFGENKTEFQFHPDTPGWLHLSGSYQPVSRNLPPPTPAQKTYHPLNGNFAPPTPAHKTYHPLPNYKCHLNKRILKISRLINVSLSVSTKLPI